MDLLHAAPLRLLAVPLLATLLAAAAVPAMAAPDGAVADDPGRVLVRFADAAPAGRALQATNGVGTTRTGEHTGITIIDVEPGTTPAAVAAQLGARADVAWAEPDRPVYASDLGDLLDDPLAGALWGIDNVGQSLLNGLVGTRDVDIDGPEAWAHTRGDAQVVVAVLDTGVDVSHPDLAGNVWTNPGEVPGNGVDDDGNGHVDDVHGWDFLNDDASVFDDAEIDSHGTHVAGTIAAMADNRRGVVGVAPGVTILPLKFMGKDGTGWTSDAVRALEYAGRAGATVVNTSWGGPGFSQALSESIAALDALVVAASGNQGQDLDVDPVYPAAYPHDNVLAVTAVDPTGQVPSFANTGNATVDLGAPGVAVLSTVPGNQYAWSTGTSMAAPHAAGVAALVASLAPDLGPAQLADRLRTTAQPLRSLRSVTATGGMVNAAAAVDGLADPPAEPEPEPEPDADTTDGSGDTTSDPAPEPEATVPSVTRLAGTDRYATAAAISRYGFPEPVRDVYVATGASFPDALSGTAAAAHAGAPVLLVAPDHVPDPIRSELVRLQPQRVWVLGGTAAVPDAVVDRLRSLTGATVHRLAGPDRTATSAVVSSRSFDAGVPVAYVATGAAFPDALGAGAAAGRLGGPVLLTDRDRLPAAVRDELVRLRPERVVVLGASSVVSDDVLHAVRAATGSPVERIGGSTRYATATQVVAASFPSRVPSVLLATGEGFPDALAGGAAAATTGSPVLLVPPTGPLPSHIVDELRRLQPTTIVVLGGGGALPTSVVDAVRAASS